MALPRFIFLNDPEPVIAIGKTYRIQTEEYQRQDLTRYCAKLYYDQDIPVDYGKQIKIGLDLYLKNHIKEAELKEIEDIKKEEARIIEAERKARIPKFTWDLSKKNKEGN